MKGRCSYHVDSNNDCGRVFFPQHFLGMAGMPRRYADYPDAFTGWNFVSSIGSYISAAGLVVFFVTVAEAFSRKRKANSNPWGKGATTLEWTLSSPPPFHRFESLPRIRKLSSGQTKEHADMEETLDFNAYLSYFLIAAYYVIMLRLWLPPPPSSGRREADDDKATASPDGKPSRAVLRQLAPTLADDDRELVKPTQAVQPAEPVERIRAADEDFDENAFLSGASQAYEIVVNAYAEGDASTLNGLLGPEAAGTFGDAINERREKGETITLDFVCIRELDIVDAWLEADRAEITVRFVSELIAVTRAADSAVIDGDPEKIVTVTDLWTFARRVSSRNPNWKVIATGEA